MYDEVKFLLDSTSQSDKPMEFKPLFLKDFNHPYLSEVFLYYEGKKIKSINVE